jgi:CDP-paratose 2-epimerase
MKILITGACGFVGMRVAKYLTNAFAGSGRSLELLGIDNFSRPGSELNRNEFSKIDLRMASDLDAIPRVDWMIDAAANPSVLAGVDGRTSSRQIIQHNLESTINMLEYCKTHSAGFALISTSRVYSIQALSQIPIVEHKNGYAVNVFESLPQGLSAKGIAEDFSTSAPISLYGSSNWQPKHLLLNTGLRLIFQFGLIAAGSLPVQGNLDARIKGF